MSVPATDRQQTIQAILEQLVASGAVLLALLANEDGFLVAAAPETEQASVVAAVGASLQQLSDRVAAERSVDEIAIQFEDRQKLVCRSILCEQTDLLLCILVRPNLPYRRLTGQAIREICAVWMAG